MFVSEGPYLLWLVMNCNTKNLTENQLGMRSPLKYERLHNLDASSEAEIGNLPLRETKIHLT